MSDSKAAIMERWADHLPPKGCLVDEFGRVWRVTYLQEWSSGKRQFTAEPAPDHAECTGLAATWCPIHGDCTSPCEGDGAAVDFAAGEHTCPLHAIASTHAENGRSLATARQSQPRPG